MKKRLFLTIKGIVQGVGFRPFIYNLATRLNLKGWVNNNSEGVYIDIEGENDYIEKFIDKIKTNPPPLSRIEGIDILEKVIKNYDNFKIEASKEENNKITLISPDIAMCDNCKHNIIDPNNRYYNYPFTNCTNCGPRFSIIKHIPYDRCNTTMNKFIMCSDCHDEYRNPLDRRFHAQPIACSSCGPSIWITNNNGDKLNISNNKILAWCKEKLLSANIFAIKGLTGFHLCCNALDFNAIQKLRNRKNRPHKPFALMAKNINIIEKYCIINEEEKKLLCGPSKPIVLLKKKNNCNIPENIAPNQNYLGFMLPYTPLHYLLFNEGIDILVMTSANLSGLPIEYTNKSAINSLCKLVDYFLLHNRDINIPLDDSVIKIILNKKVTIRRSRGYVPLPFDFQSNNSILACGSNMKNTFSINKDNFLFMSTYNGDLFNIETFNYFKKNIDHFKDIFSFTPNYIAYDLHTGYSSTKYALSHDNIKKISVQHHKAHIASCIFENNLKDNIIGICFDGTGLGEDNNIWGGEFFVGNLNKLDRIFHLDYVKIAGGDSSIINPWKLAVSYIYYAVKDKDKVSSIINKNFSHLKNESYELILKMLYSNFNTVYTSSMGRLFDAVSSIINIRNTVTYEGQAAIELESCINTLNSTILENHYSYTILNNIIKIDSIILEIIEDFKNNISSSQISMKFHNTIIDIVCNACKLIKEKYSITNVCISGGVFQNSYLLQNSYLKLTSLGFNVFFNMDVPINDSGISVGQLIIANEKINGV